MNARHRIAITGGGTGGHIYPALAVHDRLHSDPEVEAILYIGAKGHLEERLAAQRNIDFIGLASAGLPRRLTPALLTWPFKMYGAIVEAQRTLKQFKPTAVLGTGGYAAAPLLAAAKLSGIPFAIHEPDAYPGLVNRLFCRWAALCSLGMEGALSRMPACKGKVVVNGNPVSARLLHAPSREEAAAFFGLKPELLTLFITGGSQGAQAINDAVLEGLPELMAIQPAVQIVHQVGEKLFDSFKACVEAAQGSQPRYQIRPYIEDISLAYALADLTVGRSGAMTLADLSVSGTPALLIPYPFAAQDHQTSNARYVEEQGGAIVIIQSELTAAKLVETVGLLVAEPSKLAAMKQAMARLGKPNAASDIAWQLKQISENYLSKR